MTSSAVDPGARSDSGPGTGRVAVAVAIPLAVVSLAYALWWVSDRLLYIGPLDRAAFGWAVVVPVWLMTPIVAGFMWRSLTQAQARLAASLVGSLVGAVTALLFWQSVGQPLDCGFGTVTPAINFLPQALIVGLLAGGSVAVPGLIVGELARRGVRWWAVVVGLVSELALLVLTGVIGFALTWSHVCFVAPPA